MAEQQPIEDRIYDDINAAMRLLERRELAGDLTRAAECAAALREALTEVSEEPDYSSDGLSISSS